MTTYLICGLGNPGQEYQFTKHNIGFLALDEVQTHFAAPSFKENKKFNALVSEVTMGQNKVILLKPLTYMNNSGQSIRAAADYYKIEISNILPIYDDIDLDFGQIRIRKSGGPGTHNGMKSILQHLGSEDFPRIRLGIGKPHPKQDLRDYVLENFNKTDQKELEAFLAKIPAIIEEWLNLGLEMAMNKWNG